jgi:hypothetical protein
MTDKEIILAKQLAEETIYSAKGHFKTSDWIGRQLFLLVVVPFATSAITLVFTPPDWLVRLLAFAGLLFSTFALVFSYASNQQKAQEDMEKHLDCGNKYLEIYKKLRAGVETDSLTKNDLQTVTQEVSKLDQATCNLKISTIGRWHAKLALEREVDCSWMK